MYLVQILLPMYDNEGRVFDASEYVQLRSDLADRFGGVTAYTRAPARGVWKDDAGEDKRDDIVIFEVMTADLDRAWWTEFRRGLEKRFRQERVIVRALTSTLI
ncbi:MAG: hypothetical protein EHM55_20300 [Acidobacteria bacterium]|nr:MAG: hypothetical protein EHM55_20300 [Acidobacteriota bacterium]